MSQTSSYGTCAITGRDLKYGEDFIRVSVVRNYQSQGLPDQFSPVEINLSVEAFLATDLKTRIEEAMSAREGRAYKLGQEGTP